MTRTGSRVVAGGAVFLSALVAIALVQIARTLRNIETNGRAFDRGDNSVSEREDDWRSEQSPRAKSQAHEAREGRASAPEQQRVVQEARVVASVAPQTAILREVEELKLRHPRFAGVIARSEAELGIENKDPLWSAAMESRILSEVSQKALGLGITGLQVDCRTTLCRVLMLFPESLAQKQFGVVPKETAWTGQQPVGFFMEALDLELRQPVVAGLDGYGTPMVIGYVARDSRTPNQ
jgi:hypothetical protein